MSTETKVVTVKETRTPRSKSKTLPTNSNVSNIQETGSSFQDSIRAILDRPKLPLRTRALHNLYDTRDDLMRPIAVMRYLHEECYFNNDSTTYQIQQRIFGIDLVDSVRTNFPFIYRINDGFSNNTVLQAVCQERGWEEYSESEEFKSLSHRDREFIDESNWNLWWSYNFYIGRPYRSLKCWQFTNHNPRSFQICSKIYLSCFMRRMHTDHGAIYDFIPKSFVLPAEYIPFITEHSRRQSFSCSDALNIIVTNSADGFSKYGLETAPQLTNLQLQGIRTKDTVVRTPIWITKPPARSQGKGIYLFTDMCDIPSTSGGSAKAVVQEYIARPLLIGGYKWDIRIYVCVASVDPLVVYMYKEGLVRFATEKFDLSQLTAAFSHLTNASLNKLAPEYSTEKEVIGSGCKWSFKQLRKHFKTKGISDWLMWQKIMSIIVLTVVGESLSGGFSWPLSRNCFDFLGFDILIDENLRPFLLEVNYSPGLGGDCEIDDIVKKPMLHELFDLLGLPNCRNGLDDFSRSELVRTKEVVKERMTRLVRPNSTDSSSRSNRSSTNIDCTCKGRLKVAKAIYSQDFVAPYLNNLSQMPRGRMCSALQTLLRRKKIQEEQQKFTQELNRAKIKNAVESHDKEKDKPCTPRPRTVEADQNYVVAAFVHEDESTNNIPPASANNLRATTATESDQRQQSAGSTSTTDQFLKPSTKVAAVKDLRKAGMKNKRINITPETAFSRPPSLGKSSDGTKTDAEEDDGKQYVFIKRADWIHPPKTNGDWVLVYPFHQSSNNRSPYKNPIAELRGAVEYMEHYMRTCKGATSSFPNQSDEFYRRRVKTVFTRWESDLWVPPEAPKVFNKSRNKEHSETSGASESDEESQPTHSTTKP